MTKVWDPVVRIFHWCTAGAFISNYWFTHDGDIHEWLGYGVACLLFIRIVWGFVGTQHARFSDFLPTPSGLKHYVKQLTQGKHTSTTGHNPMGGLMIVTLMLLLAGTVLTGWFMTLDMFWAVPWPEEVHNLLADITQGLVFVHIVVVLTMDIFFKEGLIHAMITGNKPSI